MKHLNLSLSADLCIHSYWLSWLRQASHRKLIQNSALRLRRFKILTKTVLKFISPLISCFKFCLFVVGIWHFILFSSLLNQRQYQLKVIMNGIYETQYLMIAELLIHFYYPSFICPILLTVWQWVKIIFEVAFLFSNFARYFFNLSTIGVKNRVFFWEGHTNLELPFS